MTSSAFSYDRQVSGFAKMTVNLRVGGILLLLLFASCDLSDDATRVESGDSPHRPAQRASPPEVEWLIPEDEIVDGGPGKDGIPSIERPDFAPAGEIELVPDERMVVGVNIQGNVRAYPHQILDRHEGEVKRISAGAVEVSRGNITFNNLELTVRDPVATMFQLLSSRNAVNVEFNNGYFYGATFLGLGYNILNTNVANVRYNDCASVNSRNRNICIAFFQGGTALKLHSLGVPENPYEPIIDVHQYTDYHGLKRFHRMLEKYPDVNFIGCAVPCRALPPV